jgi:hypothetical protein
MRYLGPIRFDRQDQAARLANPVGEFLQTLNPPSGDDDTGPFRYQRQRRGFAYS